MLFIQKFPRFGIYVVMFKDILHTFVQFFMVFALFIVAFALAFYALFMNQVGRIICFMYSKNYINQQKLPQLRSFRSKKFKEIL